MTTYGPAGSQPHRRILASAGTGKTYQLVGRYLKLALGVEDPSTILATTFTRKAAAEIRDRVLRDVAGAVLDDASRRKRAKQIHGDEKIAFEHADATALLAKLIGHLPRLQICTLDSLFARIVRGLGEQAPLPIDATLLEPGEETHLLNLAIQDALGEGSEDALLETLEGLGRGGGPASLVPLIERSLKGVLDIAGQTEPTAWDWPLPPAPTEEMILPLLELLAGQAEDAGSPFPRGIQTLVRKLDLAMRDGGDAWADVAKLPILRNAFDGGTFSKASIPGEMIAPLQAVASVVAAGNARMLALRTAAIKDLVDRVEPRLADRKQDQGAATFQDVVLALDPDRHSTIDFPELWYRLDGRIHHVLLDEFQDTSTSQWRAIRPLVHEITGHLDGTRSLFVVGDVKQSIYGWRGGEPRLLEEFEDVCSEGTASLSGGNLKVSFRSGPAVLDAVNAVFASIGTNPAAVSASPDAAAAFEKSFVLHAPNDPELKGESRLEILPEPDGSETEQAVAVREAARAAAELVARHGLETADGKPTVAVLVRRNRMVAPIVEAIRANHGLPAAGRGGGSLADADAAVVVLQALRLAASPLDSIAAYDVARSPLGRVLGLPEPEPHQSPSPAVRDACSRQVRTELQREGAAALVDRWRRELEREGLLDTREGIRLRQMVEYFEGLGRASHQPEELVELARQARVDDPGSVGVVVMNIHQSKGLEFQGVVVADLDGALRGQTPQLASERPDRPDDRLARVCTWYREDARPDEAQQAHLDTITRTVRESLCMLYVAMTRACRDLVMQVRPVKIGSNGTETKGSRESVAAVLRAALGAGDDDADRSTVQVPRVFGEAWMAPDRDAARSGSDSMVRSRPILGLADSEPGRQSDQRHRNFFTISDSDATDRGTAIHACLAMVGWDGEDLPSEAEFRAEINAVAPRRDTAWVDLRLAELGRYLESPDVAQAFQKPTGRAFLGCEYPILGQSGGVVRRMVLDRLVVEIDDAGAVQRASIVDFKTDRLGRGDAAAILEAHGPQLQAYREGVMAKFGLPGDRVDARVVALEAGMVVQVPNSMPA